MRVARDAAEEAGGGQGPGLASDAGPSQEVAPTPRPAGSPDDKGPTQDAVELLQYLGSESGLATGGNPGLEEVARTPSGAPARRLIPERSAASPWPA